MMVERFKRDLIKEFRNYDRMMLMQDLMAGLTVTAVAIPLALAFGRQLLPVLSSARLAGRIFKFPGQRAPWRRY